ncbi:hypothetical protein ACFL21_00360 [Patescibacteria group bacterium]
MKDPEKFGGTESVKEDLDDMIVEAGQDTAKLEALLVLFKEMIRLAHPYTNQETGKIQAPENRLPIEKLSNEIKHKIDLIDGAFIETISYTEWIQIFYESAKRIKDKLDKIKNIKSGLK